MDMEPCYGTLPVKHLKSFSQHGTFSQEWILISHRETYCYLVHDFFCKDLISLNLGMLGRYPKFLYKLETSPSIEIRLMYKLVIRDPGSTTCKNRKYLNQLTNTNILENAFWKTKNLLPKLVIPDSDKWRIGLLTTLMAARYERNPHKMSLISVEQLEKTLHSLCTT